MTTILFRSQPESVSSDFYTTSIVPFAPIAEMEELRG
jgi:hypothetical protein